MKRKIAVLANGWNNISISQALKGIRSVTDKLNIDIFLFLSFAAFAHSEARNKGDDSIFDLSDYTEFDGVILFANMLNSEATPRRLAQRIAEKKLCGVSVGIPYEGLSFVGIDNYKGMYDMVDHLVKEHHIKNPAFFAGAKEHPDSQERLAATKEALNLNGIELKSENICYTNWEYLTGIEYAVEFCKRPDPPDAFICANDHNAIAVCIGLNSMGYSVPDDFIVTGFDNISYAETFFPSITTVYQDYEKIGYIAAWQLIEKLNGTSHSDHIVVSSSFVKNESCGCKKIAEGEPRRHRFCIDSYKKEMDNIIFQAQEVEMTTSIFNCSTYDQFRSNLFQFYSNNSTFQGDEFYFIIDENTRKNLIQSSSPIKTQYSDKMHCLVARKKGQVSAPGEFPRKELIPGYTKDDKPVVYTFSSMHFDEYLFGYVVTSDSIENIRDRTLNMYMIQMNYNIEQYRKNCRLDEMNRTLLNISNTDQLTGLNNRFGMNQNALPILESSHKKGIPCAVVFVDINRMKYINDNFGHLQGDLAIRTVASELLGSIPKEWVGIRYGGDEFLAVGACEEEDRVKTIVKDIQDNLEKHVASMKLTYPLTVSIGYILSDPSSESSLIDYVNKADSLMYRNKQRTYEKED
ncbi:MAG: GGDEF domain-containing protein [Treponemataceae bacterium]|nr:GGDEF domain-containing protein [Treponemataceae bacterium]